MINKQPFFDLNLYPHSDSEDSNEAIGVKEAISPGIEVSQKEKILKAEFKSSIDLNFCPVPDSEDPNEIMKQEPSLSSKLKSPRKETLQKEDLYSFSAEVEKKEERISCDLDATRDLEFDLNKFPFDDGEELSDEEKSRKAAFWAMLKILLPRFY